MPARAGIRLNLISGKAVQMRLGFMKDSRNVFTIIFSSISLIASIVALAVALPRVQLGFDYLGVIVTILGAIVTMLVGFQLYQALNLKEDAKKVAEAKEVIEKYAEQVTAIEGKINKLEEQAKNAVYVGDLRDE